MTRPLRLLVLALLLWPMPAHADLAPPKGQVERCTIERQQLDGETCVSCSTYFAEADACEKKHGARGLSFRCRTSGASTWTELWCKHTAGVDVSSLRDPADGGAEGSTAATPTSSAATPSPSVDPPAQGSNHAGTPSPDPTPSPHATPPGTPEKSGSCGACTLGLQRETLASVGWAWLALAAAAAARRRRR